LLVRDTQKRLTPAGESLANSYQVFF